MSTPILFVEPRLAQTSSKPTKPKPITTEPAKSPGSDSGQMWMMASGGLFVLLIALGVLSKLSVDRLGKQLKFETFKNRELQKKLKYAVETIGKMERNPDLIHSREFNLDYLRMRMDEEVFHFAILNQIKIRVKEKISVALRPTQGNQGEIGIASTGRQVDEVFDVEYEPGDLPKGTKRVLFRIQIKILKLPTQPTSVTISQIIDCMETFLSPAGENDTWQPTIQGRIANMHWDQKAKPTPLLVLEQTQEGTNVTFRTTRMTQT
ncbi:hypothetical protein K9N68_32455 [Kovacikia minuta CCNUW1]|uniref:hypothetical protein n=1 Tax=Kovacikia minuta TaxID=2931930 RepID=UPI001CC91E26|nr:hypothetical protein [Kovacikia minuta]UBF26179.1 hypothetical protein K9N68_32455 [Kovacikia minuta CCNUW1]